MASHAVPNDAKIIKDGNQECVFQISKEPRRDVVPSQFFIVDRDVDRPKLTPLRLEQSLWLNRGVFQAEKSENGLAAN